MKTLKVLWGLLVDDGRLASILIVALIIGSIVSAAGLKTLGAVAIWLGLLVSLGVSIEHQLKLKLKKK